MHMLSAFNRAMAYLETVLDGAVDEREVSRLTGYSYAMFGRLFSMLTGFSLAEYIRLRRLTRAALDLRQTDSKIIDIALKYGYDSADAFGYAFRQFHENTPSAVRAGAAHKVISRIQLTLGIKGGRNMDIRIEKKPAFTVAGRKEASITPDRCPAVWDALFHSHRPAELAALGNGQSYGVCYDMPAADRIHYMAGYDMTDPEKAAALHLDTLAIPANEYAVVQLKGPVPTAIHEGWKYLMEVFFPEHGYMHSGDPDLEVYGDGDLHAEDYEMELWVPVKRV